MDPLVELLDKQNPNTAYGVTRRHGVFDTDPGQTLVLLVDFKTDGHDTWPYVESQLSALREKDYLTYFNGTATVPGAVTVVGTGNAPFDLVTANSTYRDIFFDAPLDKLTEPSQQRRTKAKREQGNTGTTTTSADSFNASTSYYASVSFSDAVGSVRCV